jgi:hypothetical protein
VADATSWINGTITARCGEPALGAHACLWGPEPRCRSGRCPAPGGTSARASVDARLKPPRAAPCRTLPPPAGA